MADGGAVLVPDSYIRYIVDLANEKYDQNLDKIRKFEAELFRVLQDPDLGSDATGEPGTKSGSKRAAPAAGLAAVPARRRRGGGEAAAAAGAGSVSALEGLKRRQAAVLGRVRALEARLGLAGSGAVAAAVAALAAVAKAKPAAVKPVAKAALAAVASVAATKAVAKPAAAAATAAGSGGAGPLLRWLGVPVFPEQVRVRVRLCAVDTPNVCLMVADSVPKSLRCRGHVTRVGLGA